MARTKLVPRSKETASAGGKRPFPVKSNPSPWLSKPMKKRPKVARTAEQAWMPHRSGKHIAGMSVAAECRAFAKRIWSRVMKYFNGAPNLATVPGTYLAINLRDPDQTYPGDREPFDRVVVMDRHSISEGDPDLLKELNASAGSRDKSNPFHKRYFRGHDLREFVYQIILSSQYYRFPKHTQLWIPVTPAADGRYGSGEFVFEFRSKREYHGKNATHSWRYQPNTPVLVEENVEDPIVIDSEPESDIADDLEMSSTEDEAENADETEAAVASITPVEEPEVVELDPVSLCDVCGDELDDAGKCDCSPPACEDCGNIFDPSAPCPCTEKPKCNNCSAEDVDDECGLCPRCFDELEELPDAQTWDNEVISDYEEEDNNINKCHVCDKIVDDNSRLCNYCRDGILIKIHSCMINK